MFYFLVGFFCAREFPFICFKVNLLSFLILGKVVIGLVWRGDGMIRFDSKVSEELAAILLLR